jgi:hypothetical protein
MTRNLVSAAQKLAKELDGNHAAAGNELLTGIGCRVVVQRDSIPVVLPKHQLRIRLLGAVDLSVSPKEDEARDAETLSVHPSLRFPMDRA